MAYVEVDEPIVLDSTGQDIKDSLDDIKSAVQGLGTALGSDKANISGDNIANPATFRSNIGLKIVQKYIQATATIGNTPINDILDLPTPSTARVFLQYYNATNDTFGLIMKRADNGQIRATNTISANHWIYIAGVYI
jgi:hypothetical protein